MTTPTDPLYDDQWHFSLIGDIESIWEEYDGSGVTVVVYDEGVEYTHEDLAANYDASMHFTYDGVTYDPMPLDADSGHGTSCAGLIGSVANNGLGGTGVAPGVTLTGVNYLDDIQFQSAEIYDAGVLWAQNFDIMSNSWGWGGSFSFAQNLSISSSTASHDMELWAILLEAGRDGLGTVIVQAAGNETNNANGDGWNVSRYSITVAATDQNGNAEYYTNFGSSILIAAPASAVTTDLSGNAGYNGSGDADPVDSDYTSDFNGTSAATPTVAGVVALMLDANDTLGWRDVQTILALSAAHTGSDMGGPGELEEVGDWQTVGGNTWNGGGTMFHQSYGYGMLDAFAAVRMAEAWTIMSPVAKTSANEVTATGSYSGSAVAIPDNNNVPGTGQVALDLVVSQNIAIEAIEVTLTLTHANATNLNIWLEAPDGTRIQMMTEGDASARTTDRGLTWVFGVDSLKGFTSAGTWSVVFEDTVTGETGSVSGASIEFFGGQVTPDTLFHFTDDFIMLSDLEAARSVIDDLDGGLDWLNFAAMAGDLTVSLLAGGAIALNGVVIATLAAGADEIESALMGDGKDSVKGNGLANELHGMRGDDMLRGANGGDAVLGGAGKDVLHGDNGNDTLWGGAGNDKIYGTADNDNLWGEADRDTFIFAVGFGSDRVKDFADNIDQLRLDDAIWGGGKTAAQVVAAFASVVDGNTLFNFGGGQKITVSGVTDTSVFLNDIVIF